MKFYKVNEQYVKYLTTIDKKVSQSQNIIGIPLRMNELIYFLPYFCLDESDKDSTGKIKKTQPTIFRLFDLNTKDFYGKILLSNMFAVPYKDLAPLDYSQYSHEQIILMDKVLQNIKKNKDRLEKAAMRLFQQKIRGYKQPYLASTLDFLLIEKASVSWEIEHYGRHINRFPDKEFFLTNPRISGVSSYYLMNKMTKVAEISFDNSNQKVISIKELFNTDYAPLECFKGGKLDKDEITKWFRGRGIPSRRDGLDDLLESLGIQDKDMLLNKAYGLSLSDHYWMNPKDRPMDWKDINFFEHDFYSQDFIEATFENKILDTKKIDFYSPNNTSDGMLKKAWIIGPNKKRYLLKASYKYKGLEPFNEVLAGMICKVIDLDFVPYTIEVLSNMVFSKCECFINTNTELVSAYAILKEAGIGFDLDEKQAYQLYLSLLSKKGINNVKEKITKMFILDYIMVNQDRHLGNFGIIRNVDTLEWIDVAPNFDSGQSMFSQFDIYQVNFKNAHGSFFTKKDVDFEKILKIVLDECSLDIDFNQLKKVPNQWKDILLSYQYISLISEAQINELIKGLNQRIELLENHFKKT